MNKINIEPELGSVPEIKTQYWYVRSNYLGENFTVTETEWVGGISDLYRLTKGNVYLSRKEAEKVMMMLNDRLDRLKSITANARQKERLAESIARKKAEAAERKRLRESKRSLDQKEREQQYENNKKRRAQKESPHPDVIIFQ